MAILLRPRTITEGVLLAPRDYVAGRPANYDIPLPFGVVDSRSIAFSQDWNDGAYADFPASLPSGVTFKAPYTSWSDVQAAGLLDNDVADYLEAPVGTYVLTIGVWDPLDGTGTYDVTLNFTEPDVIAPTGYSIAWFLDSIDSTTTNGNKYLTMNSVEVGTTYQLTLTSSGGGTPQVLSGAIVSSPQTINVATTVNAMLDGTITASLTLTDAGPNTGAAVTDTVVKLYSVPILTLASGSQTGAFQLTAQVNTNQSTGTLYVGIYTTATPQSAANIAAGTGAVASDNTAVSSSGMYQFVVNGIDDGQTYYLQATHQTVNGYATVVVSPAIVISDITTPTGYSVTWGDANDEILASEVASTTLTMAGAEVGTTYEATLTSSAGGTAQILTGTVSSANQSISAHANFITAFNALPDGVITASVTLDDGSNEGAPVTDTVNKYTGVPVVYGSARGLTNTSVRLNFVTNEGRSRTVHTAIYTTGGVRTHAEIAAGTGALNINDFNTAAPGVFTVDYGSLTAGTPYYLYAYQAGINGDSAIVGPLEVTPSTEQTRQTLWGTLKGAVKGTLKKVL